MDSLSGLVGKRGPTAENKRKTHCIRGHELSGENLYITTRGRRHCRACQIECNRTYREKKATPTYITWRSMHQRCKNPNYANYGRYGGRGISVHSSWDSFEQFVTDMGERPPGMTIDRIDNDGNYEPGNCRWATAKEQAATQTKGGTAAANFHKTHCIHGHPLSGDNLRIVVSANGKRRRECRECRRENDRRKRRRHSVARKLANAAQVPGEIHE